MVLVKCDCRQSTTSAGCYRCRLGASGRPAFIEGNFCDCIHSNRENLNNLIFNFKTLDVYCYGFT